jgi:hypothetical protein
MDDEITAAVSAANRVPVRWPEVAYAREKWRDQQVEEAIELARGRPSRDRSTAARQSLWEGGGHPRVLAKLMRRQPDILLSRMTPAIWALIADYIEGKKLRKPGGLESKTREERRASSPIHRAAEMVPHAERILTENYPKEPRADVRDMALRVIRHFLGAEVGIDQLENYLARSKKDERRLAHLSGFTD